MGHPRLRDLLITKLFETTITTQATTNQLIYLCDDNDNVVFANRSCDWMRNKILMLLVWWHRRDQVGHLPVRSLGLDRDLRLPLQGHQVQRQGRLLHCHLSLRHPHRPPGQGAAAWGGCRRSLVKTFKILFYALRHGLISWCKNSEDNSTWWN